MCHLPCRLVALAGATIISSLKPRPGPLPFSGLPVLFLTMPLGQGGYKIPISFRMDFVISQALPPLAPSAASMFVAKT